MAGNRTYTVTMKECRPDGRPVRFTMLAGIATSAKAVRESVVGRFGAHRVKSVKEVKK